MYSYFLCNTETLPYRIFSHSWLSSLLDRYLNISASSTLFSLNNNCCPIKSCEYLWYWMSVYQAPFRIPYFLLFGIFIGSWSQLCLEVQVSVTILKVRVQNSLWTFLFVLSCRDFCGQIKDLKNLRLTVGQSSNWPKVVCPIRPLSSSHQRPVARFDRVLLTLLPMCTWLLPPSPHCTRSWSLERC